MKWKFIAKNYRDGSLIKWKIFKFLNNKTIKHRWLWHKRKKKNSHNNTKLVFWDNINNSNTENLDSIEVGNYTYWPIDVRELFEWKLKIWSYCALAQWVKFILWNHNYKLILQQTVPYKFHAKHFWICLFGIKEDFTPRDLSKVSHFSNWETVVWDDVRIWTWAKIMSWVHIWQWAVIAAWAVVTKDIPPYAIAWWVPAKVIKYRFSEDKIKKLLQIDYSNIPIEKFREIYPETIKEDFDIDYILEKLKE